MSLDRQDVARSSQEALDGRLTEIWPIIVTVPGAYRIGAEFEVSMNPCDSIWLPSYYDGSIGLNQAQIDLPSAYGIVSASYGIGQNISTISDVASSAIWSKAAIWSLRINSRSNPWMLWGIDAKELAAINNTGTGYFEVATSSTMRSLSGPITRMWAKLLRPATANNNNSGTNYNYSRIVLMSSLGYSQSTQEFANAFADINGVLTPSQIMPANLGVSVSNSPYISPQLNSQERAALRRMEGE